MNSDKILVMDSGQVVEFDHPYNLLQNSNGFFYKYLHKSPKTIAENLISIAEKVKLMFILTMN
jgi:ATP-binding cassette subfamily C (CFTR/MRP) protein 4